MYYSTLIIEQNFILNSAFLKILLEILSESNAAIQCCTSSLSHFVYSWQEPRQNADCQSCTGKGMLCSAQSFISCSQLESAEHWTHLRNHLQELKLKLSKPGFYGTMCDECCSWQFFPPPHFPPLHVSVLFWHWSCSSAQTRSWEPTQCEVGAANCAIKSIK